MRQSNTSSLKRMFRLVDSACCIAVSSFTLTGCVVLVLASCASNNEPASNYPATLSSADSAQIIAEVTKAVDRFHAADTSRDAAAVVSLLWPEYTMMVDGNRITYETVASGSKEFMASLALFHTEWTGLEIIPTSESTAISSFMFRDSLVFKNGTVTQSRGPTTLVWQQRDDQWRAIFGDADHYPLTEGSSTR